MDHKETITDAESMSTSSQTLMSLGEGTKAMAVQALKTVRKNGSYLLRSSIHKAKMTHFCSCCMSYILPGETYEKMVRALGNGIVEFNTHRDPACDFPEDPMERHEAEHQEEEITYSAAA